MPAHIKGKTEVIECFFERVLKWAGFVCIRDGSQFKEGDQARDPSFFTRIYRWKPDGKYVNTYIKVIHDKRKDLADFTISWKDLALFERLAAEREAEFERLAAERDKEEQKTW